MTDKERFLMKFLFEYNWKDAFSDVKISDKAQVYYPNRNWFNFAKLQNDNIYSESTDAMGEVMMCFWLCKRKTGRIITCVFDLMDLETIRIVLENYDMVD